jgi:hypothetical protein
MEAEKHPRLISVELPLSFVHGLLALTHLMDRRVTDTLRSALEEHQSAPTAPEPKTPSLTASPKRASPVLHDTSLLAEILGQLVSGANLSDLFARCVDVVHELDPSAIERLAGKKTHARRYVARRRENIHLKSPHLETIETESGWCDERQPSWPVPTTTLAGGSGRKTGMPVWRAAPPA